jgi:hypothetical protein
MAGLISFRPAKPNDPIYKEGWSIHIGPLLGTRTANEPSDKAKTAEKEGRGQHD